MSRQHRFQRRHRCAPELPGAAMAYLTSYQALVHRRLIGVPVGQMRRVFCADPVRTYDVFTACYSLLRNSTMERLSPNPQGDLSCPPRR